jgi:hypothetical protein
MASRRTKRLESLEGRGDLTAARGAGVSARRSALNAIELRIGAAGVAREFSTQESPAERGGARARQRKVGLRRAVHLEGFFAVLFSMKGAKHPFEQGGGLQVQRDGPGACALAHGQHLDALGDAQGLRAVAEGRQGHELAGLGGHVGASSICRAVR